MLRVAAARWHNELAPLPKPMLVVNIGGPTSMVTLCSFPLISLVTTLNEICGTVVAGHCKYGNDLAIELVSALKMVLATCGSVRISFSQRTPVKVNFTVQNSL